MIPPSLIGTPHGQQFPSVATSHMHCKESATIGHRSYQFLLHSSTTETYPSTSAAMADKRWFSCQSGMFNMRLNHTGSV